MLWAQTNSCGATLTDFGYLRRASLRAMRFSEEHLQLRRTVREFVAKELNPHVDAWERDGAFPAHEVFGKLGKLGLLGVNKPEAYGGMGLDYSFQMIVTEELGTCAAGSLPMAIGVQTDMATPALARWGSDDLKKEFLAPSIAGELVASIAVSEASGGSDVAAIKTVARKDGADYVIDGSKMWITNAAQADWLCLLVDHQRRSRRTCNKSLIVVPTRTPRASPSARSSTSSACAPPTPARCTSTSVRVPQRHRIGETEGAWASPCRWCSSRKSASSPRPARCAASRTC